MAHVFTDIGMGVILVENDMYEDDRGSMAEWYNREVFHENGIRCDFSQQKSSRSKKGVLRGFHFQYPPYEQAKLIRCIAGEVFAAIVDVRADSGSYKHSITLTMKGDGRQAVYLPKGFAMAFLVTSEEDAIIMYYIDGEWVKEKEGGVIWNDPEIGIKWPAAPSIISRRDMELPRIKNIVW